MFSSTTAPSYQQQAPKVNFGGNGFGPMGGGMGQMGAPQQSQQFFQQTPPVAIQQPYGGGNSNYNVFGTSNSDQGSPRVFIYYLHRIIC